MYFLIIVMTVLQGVRYAAQNNKTFEITIR